MNNRNYKSFPKEAITFLKLHRHDRLDIFIYSQAEDYDVTVRRLCERMYILRKSRIRCFSSLQLVYPEWVSDQVSGQVRVQWILAPFPAGIKWFYRPRYYKYFDSWTRPELPALPAESSFTSTEMSPTIKQRLKDILGRKQSAESSIPSDASPSSQGLQGRPTA